MGITLNQFDQLAGGIAKGYKEGSTTRRDNAENRRQQGEADRTRTDWEQEQAAKKALAEQPPPIIPYEQTFAAIQKSRATMDERWAGGLNYAAPPGDTAGILGIGAMPKLAEGGQVEVDPAAAGLPAGQPTQPTQQPPPSQYKTRREEYKAWQQKAASAAAMSGGLDGLKAFQDHENALSRKQMLGYGMEGVTAMRDGNAGEAVRQLNTMLDVSPEDTGMRWEAYDGKVHLVGTDGNKGKPYNQDAVMALIENNIKTPENYLDFQEQSRKRAADAETVRSSKEDERLARKTQKEVERAALENEKVARQEADAETAKALAAMINSTANRTKALKALRDAEDNNWSDENALKIVGDSHAFALEDFTAVTEDIQDYYNDNPIAWADFKSDLAAVQLANQYDEASGKGLVEPDLAAVISQLVRQPGGGFNLADVAPDFHVDTHPDAPGQLFAVYKGKYVRLPEMMHADARKNFDIQEGGGKESNPDTPPAPTAEAGLPTEASGPPSPAPPGSPELAPEDAAAGYRYLQMRNGQWQLTNQAGDPVQTNVPAAPPPANFPGRGDAYIMGQRRG